MKTCAVLLLVLIGTLLALSFTAKALGPASFGSGAIAPTGTAAPTKTPGPTPLPTPSLPLSQANGGTGAISLNAASIGQTLCTQAGNPLSTINGQTFGVNTTMFSCVIPANTLGPFDVVQMHFGGDFQNNSGGSQNYIWALTVGGKGLVNNALAEASAATYHNFQGWVYFYNDGATNLNSMSGFFDVGTAAAGVQTGTLQGATNAFIGGYQAMAIDTTNPQTVLLTVAVGAPTSGATPSPTPTSATTPILHLYGLSLGRWPGITPTPTPLPTQTPTPTPLPTQTPTPAPT